MEFHIYILVCRWRARVSGIGWEEEKRRKRLPLSRDFLSSGGSRDTNPSIFPRERLERQEPGRYASVCQATDAAETNCLFRKQSFSLCRFLFASPFCVPSIPSTWFTLRFFFFQRCQLSVLYRVQNTNFFFFFLFFYIPEFWISFRIFYSWVCYQFVFEF